MSLSGCKRIGSGIVVLCWLGFSALGPAAAQVLEPLESGDQQAPPDAVASPAKAGAWTVQSIQIPEAPSHIRSAGPPANLDQVTIETTSGALYSLADCGDGLCAERIGNPRPSDPLPMGALPGSVVATGRHTIARAWLAEPAQRLLGSTLGGPVAGALVVEDVTARTFRLDLPTSQAFEDRRPRIVDLGPDNPDTILLVRSAEDTGAALVAIGLSGEGLLQTVAETPPLGTPRAWLNPIGTGDFTGSGSTDVAIVTTPDAGGTLQILSLQDRQFQQRFTIRNISNHAPGSDTIDMAVVADFDADGLADIAAPDADRQHIRILSFANGRVAEPASIALPAPVVTEIAAVSAGAGKRPYLLMGLADGQLVLLH